MLNPTLRLAVRGSTLPHPPCVTTETYNKSRLVPAITHFSLQSFPVVTLTNGTVVALGNTDFRNF